MESNYYSMAILVNINVSNISIHQGLIHLNSKYSLNYIPFSTYWAFNIITIHYYRVVLSRYLVPVK